MIVIVLSWIPAYISYISSEKKILSFQQHTNSSFKGLFVWNSGSRLVCLQVEDFDQK